MIKDHCFSNTIKLLNLVYFIISEKSTNRLFTGITIMPFLCLILISSTNLLFLCQITQNPSENLSLSSFSKTSILLDFIALFVFISVMLFVQDLKFGQPSENLFCRLFQGYLFKFLFRMRNKKTMSRADIPLPMPDYYLKPSEITPFMEEFGQLMLSDKYFLKSSAYD